MCSSQNCLRRLRVVVCCCCCYRCSRCSDRTTLYTAAAAEPRENIVARNWSSQRLRNIAKQALPKILLNRRRLLRICRGNALMSRQTARCCGICASLWGATTARHRTTLFRRSTIHEAGRNKRFAIDFGKQFVSLFDC